MEIEIVHSKSNKTLTKLSGLTEKSSIKNVKEKFHVTKPSLYPDRQSYKTDPKGKTLKDSETLGSLSIKNGGKLYFRDLGPQVGWTTVFLTEYAGPLVIYLLFYTKPACIYGDVALNAKTAPVVKIACACWTFHYAKRLLETLFIHRFSHATMPIMNIFKNSAYYWGFAAFVSYFVNHPLYTPPMLGDVQVYGGLAFFALCELGNFSVHVALRNLRPPGTKERRIPYPTSNPLTSLFWFVSCPNYTYEVGAWAAFTFMTQCLPAGLFTLAGFYQMAVWALGKHRNYKKEFEKYPKNRKAILPFIL